MLVETISRTERGYPPEDAEVRHNLVRRIVASSAFAKSNRLSEFLRYVYSLAERGRFEDIHEQNIGSAIFDRNRDYDPAADSIVRSHASRLRQRLKVYFEEEGKDEPIVLTVPRGSYVPQFEHRTRPIQTIGILTDPDHTAELLQSQSIDAIASGPDELEDRSGNSIAGARRKIRLLKIALAIAAVLIVSLVSALVVRYRAVRDTPRTLGAINRSLWGQFLSGGQVRTMVISSDSGIVMYQHLTGRSVSLSSYLSGEYLTDTSSAMAAPEVVRKFATRRYTPAVDLSVFERLTHLFEGQNQRMSFRYARDLRVEDLKQGNVIFLGSAESNPWVQLYEPTLNFRFQDDLLHDRAQMINLHPREGESAHYDSTPLDATPTIYGVAAYRANLKSSGHVLILEGQTMAGTQAAADFIFDDQALSSFLDKIRLANGSIPDFEVLLRSRSLAGQSSQIEIVAFRTQ